MSEHTDDTPTEDTEKQERIRTDERVGMDDGDLEDAIDQEQDQKVKPDDDSRYEDEVDKSLSDETR